MKMTKNAVQNILMNFAKDMKNNYDYASSVLSDAVSSLSIGLKVGDADSADNLIANYKGHPTYATPTGTSPTVDQFYQAAAISAMFTPNIPPPGTSAFLVNGKQLQLTDPSTGALGRAWVTDKHQIMITYQTTDILYNGTKQQFLNSQVAADIAIFQGNIVPAETQALTFANQVTAAALKQGYSLNDIFVTGHSLGGTMAEYVAQQTGLGGMAFVSTGIPSNGKNNSGGNFINVISYGDPFSMHDAALASYEPGISTMTASNVAITHYGRSLVVGSEAAGDILAATTKLFCNTEPLKCHDVTSDYVKSWMGAVDILAPLSDRPSVGLYKPVEHAASELSLFVQFGLNHLLSYQGDLGVPLVYGLPDSIALPGHTALHIGNMDISGVARTGYTV